MSVTMGAVASGLIDTDCGEAGIDDQPVDTTAVSAPFAALSVGEAWQFLERRSQPPGAGVRVAVLDSGVSPAARLTVVEQVSFSLSKQPGSYQGTAVAGLVAGPPRDPARGTAEPLAVGFAPGAGIVDVRVYDSTAPQDGEVGVEPARVAAGLRWVAENAERLDIGVANVSLAVEPTDELEAAVRAVAGRDVVVVAAAGNRPLEGERLFAQFGGEPALGEDARGAIFPAGYDGVVAVGATAGGVDDESSDPASDSSADSEGVVEEADPRASVLQNSAIDVAVPTYNAVTTSITGGTCLLPSVLTTWAAGEVSGVVAMMRARFPEENADQIIARLRDTADGSPDNPTVLTGAGIVQPLEALARPLRPAKDGTVMENVAEEDVNPRATAPIAPEDRLAQTRRNAVWLGLIGGTALVIAALLRPLLARRRARGSGASTEVS